MIVVFDKYTDNTRKLLETMQSAALDVKVVVLNDDGFLPRGILSPYAYYTYGKEEEILEEKDLFFDFIEVPEFWEIRAVGLYGGIYDMGCKKADIYFTDPIEKRNVKRVEWCMENGWKYKIDHYNKYALKYASEFLDIDGNVESKVFYSGRNQEMVVEQPQNDVVTLLEGGKTRAFFVSYAEFLAYYMEEIGAGEKRVLFVENDEGFQCLEYKSGDRSMWEYVWFPSDGLLNKYVNMGGKNGYCFCNIPKEYPANSAKGEALVLTASDRLERIEELIHELPEVTFHIAASTQVSDKLRRLGEHENVKVYPQISKGDLNALWDKCDFYLDINYFQEVQNAIDTAQQKNLLIMGFENIIHNKKLITEECVFPSQDFSKFTSFIKTVMQNPDLMKRLLEKQQCKKRQSWKEFMEAVGLTEE